MTGIRTKMRALSWIALAVTPLPCLAQFAEAAVDLHEGRVAAAIEVLEPLARDGDAPAQYLMGKVYFDGRGLPQDRSKALEYFESAAQHGNTAAECALGTIYYTGEGAPKDAAKAAFWFQRANAAGSEPARARLAWLYDTGAGVAEDREKAKSLLRKEDLPFPVFSIAECGWEEPPDVAQISARRFEEAVARGDPGAEFLRGEGYFREKNFADAAGWFEKAASHGHANAQYTLAMMYFQGQGVPRDPVKGTHWMEQAAEQWDLIAMKMLYKLKLQATPEQAYMYAYLLDVAVDPEAKPPSGGDLEKLSATQIADGVAAAREFLRRHPRPPDIYRRYRSAYD